MIKPNQFDVASPINADAVKVSKKIHAPISIGEVERGNRRITVVIKARIII